MHTAHPLEDADDVLALKDRQRLEMLQALFLIVRDDHGAHRRDLLGLEEHVLGTAQPDALGPELARLGGLLWSVSVGVHLWWVGRWVGSRTDVFVR